MNSFPLPGEKNEQLIPRTAAVNCCRKRIGNKFQSQLGKEEWKKSRCGAGWGISSKITYGYRHMKSQCSVNEQQTHNIIAEFSLQITHTMLSLVRKTTIVFGLLEIHWNVARYSANSLPHFVHNMYEFTVTNKNCCFMIFVQRQNVIFYSCPLLPTGTRAVGRLTCVLIPTS